MLATEVDIPDKNLRAFLLKNLIHWGIIPEGATTITTEDLARLQGNLSYTNIPESEKIVNLEGIQYCTNVNQFNFNNNKINQFPTPFISNNLTVLFLSNNELESLPDFSGLNGLQILSLNHNKLSNLENFARLPTNLNNLQLQDNPIGTLPDMSQFTRLTHLLILDLTNTGLTEISSLKGLPESLFQLTLNRNDITDVTDLAKFKHLNMLGLSGNPRLEDIHIIQDFTSLNQLLLAYTNVSDISSLKNLVNLTQVTLSNNRISSIEALENMSHLMSLTLNNNFIRDISPLKNKPHLNILTLDYNQITDLSPLKDSPLSLSFSATHQVAHLPSLIIYSNRMMIPYPVKDQHGKTVPPRSQTWTYYTDTPNTISWDNCYGWGNRVFHFASSDRKFSGEIHLFYQHFHRRDRHYRL